MPPVTSCLTSIPSTARSNIAMMRMAIAPTPIAGYITGAWCEYWNQWAGLASEEDCSCSCEPKQEREKGTGKGDEGQAAHKVPKRAKGRAGAGGKRDGDAARELLKNCCIGVNSALNGAPLSYNDHSKTGQHTHVAYAEVRDQAEKAAAKGCQGLVDQLKNWKFPKTK